MAEQKVQFNLHNVHYAIMKDDGTYETPVAIPGAVSLSLDHQGDTEKFYADGVAYYVAIANNGYSGTLEVARFPDKMMQDVWGYTLGATSKVLTETADVEPATFALLFKVDGDAGDADRVMYACTATRPNIAANTSNESKNVQTQSCSIECVPLASGKVCARTTADTPTSTKTAWYTTVFVED